MHEIAVTKRPPQPPKGISLQIANAAAHAATIQMIYLVNVLTYFHRYFFGNSKEKIL